jgi:hypothetical protein
MVKVKSFVCALLLCALLPAPAFASAAEDRLERDFSDSAVILQELGLFRGSDKGFELDRAPTRTEAAVMLVRLLGKEDEALARREAHPFNDVPAWATPYIAYMYANELTRGVSETAFGTGPCDARMYASFALRALGYDDAKGDFSYEDALSFACEVDMLSEENLERLEGGATFLRGDLAVLSLWALFTELKGDELYLIDRLVSEQAADTAAARKYTDILRAETLTSRGFFLSEEERGFEARIVETQSISEAGYAPFTTTYILNSKAVPTATGWREISEVTQLAPDSEDSFVVYSEDNRDYYDFGDEGKFWRDAEPEEEALPMTLSGLFLQFKSAAVTEKDGKTIISEEMSDETARKRALALVAELLGEDEETLRDLPDDAYTLRLRHCTDTYTLDSDGYVLQWTENIEFYFQFRVSLRETPPYLIAVDKAADYINPGAPVEVVFPDLRDFVER